jgi:glutamate--cysteine ligase
MTAFREHTGIESEPRCRPLRSRVEAEAYVASVCFKHGPPELSGIELEWTVHHSEDPAAELDVSRLVAALADNAPKTLVENSPSLPLPGGSSVTVEPGGQVEISSAPTTSLAALLSAARSDTAVLRARLAAAGLSFGEHGVDAFRRPRRVLHTPRYSAMERAFESRGTDGLTMMCSTAGLQVCVDAGEEHRVAARWEAVHALGPVLCGLFGNTAPESSHRPGWASARQRAVFGSDPVRMRPAAVTKDPAAAWARRVLDAPVMCVRSDAVSWAPAVAMSFAEWIDGAGEAPPTVEDLDYHLTTMFPPVRPHGYLEVRYVDAQRGDDWIAPAALVVALFAEESTVDSVRAAAAPAAGRWLRAARYGLGDHHIRRAATAVVDIGAEAIATTDLDETLAAQVIDQLRARLAA